VLLKAAPRGTTPTRILGKPPNIQMSFLWSAIPTLFQVFTPSLLQVTEDYNAAFTGLNAAMIDFYGHSKFKAFTDCGLDLGWSHANASNPPQWPENDCYHTCNTNCVKTTPEDENTTGNITNPDQPGSTGAAMAGVPLQGWTMAISIFSVLSALVIL